MLHSSVYHNNVTIDVGECYDLIVVYIMMIVVNVTGKWCMIKIVLHVIVVHVSTFCGKEIVLYVIVVNVTTFCVKKTL